MVNNKITIAGKVSSTFTYSHKCYNECFYQFFINVKRTSGTVDSLPVIVSESLIDVTKDMSGCYVSIVGELKSYSHKSKLHLYIFPELIQIIYLPQNINDVYLQGTIKKDPVIRETPYGRIITDVLLCVNRDYNKNDYIPCIAWGRLAYFLSDFKTGDGIRIGGRFQSRNYNKNNETKTAYELSINLIETV